MKNCILPILALLIFSACSNDEPILTDLKSNEVKCSTNTNPYRVSLDDALKSANALLNQMDDGIATRSSRSVKEVNYVTNPKTRGYNADTLLYVINYDDDKGFAILGADARIEPIYCISGEGELNLNDTVTNKGLAMLYNQYIAEAAYTVGYGYNPDSSFQIRPDIPPTQPYPIIPDWGERKITYLTRITPKLSKYANRWGQGSPYNKNCHSEGAPSAIKYNLVGCTPLACAQIMSYYEWPISYNGVNLNWSEIKNWSENLYSIMCPPALSQFLKEVGETLNVKWDIDETQCFTGNIVSYFGKFGYSPIGKGKKLNHTDGSAALERGPLLISGNNEDPKKSGHTWVIDGYLSYKEEWPGVIVNPIDPDNCTIYYFLFHCVWGWNGKNNGYFRCPDGESTETIPYKYDGIDLGENDSSVKDYSYINLTYWSDFKPIK